MAVWKQLSICVILAGNMLDCRDRSLLRTPERRFCSRIWLRRSRNCMFSIVLHRSMTRESFRNFRSHGGRYGRKANDEWNHRWSSGGLPIAQRHRDSTNRSGARPDDLRVAADAGSSPSSSPAIYVLALPGRRRAARSRREQPPCTAKLIKRPTRSPRRPGQRVSRVLHHLVHSVPSPAIFALAWGSHLAGNKITASLLSTLFHRK